MPKIEVVLWDLDDTLINTTVTRLQAQRHMVETVIAALPAAQPHSVDQGLEKVERLVQLFGSTYYSRHISLFCRELLADPAIQQYLIEIGHQAYREVFWRITTVEGAKKTLQELKMQGYQLGLVSNGLYPLQMQKLIRTGLETYFNKDLIFISSHYHRQFDLPPTENEYSREDLADPVQLEFVWLKDSVEKPWPWMLKLALKACDCPANHVIYVGDRITDFVSARLAGVWSVKVHAHSTSEASPLLSIEEPHFSIDKVADIFSIISQINRL